jgi:OOP family OmpA-OmpF porin
VITDKPIRLEGANFATGSSKLLSGASAKLDEVVQAAKDHPEISFEVSGYTDNVGNARANVRLSQARADAVKAYLVGKGVAARRIDTRGFGEQDPVADNKTAEGRAQNRRVEIRYTDKVETRVRVTQ